jgi:hypothetical protein
MASSLTTIAFAHGSRKLIPDTHSFNLKNGLLKSFPNVRIVFVKTTRVNGTDVHVLHLKVTTGTEKNYAALFDRIGNDFYQGEQIVVYKWKSREELAAKSSKHSEKVEPSRRDFETSTARLGWKPSSTMGASLDPSIAVQRFERRKISA